MSFLEHVDELRGRLLRVVATVLVITLFSFLFGIKEFQFGNVLVNLPYPNPFDNIAALVIKRIQNDMLPENVKLIVTSPGQAIIAQFYVALFLGVVFGMPMIVYQIAAFVGPGLHPHERRSIRKILLPSIILFVVGGLSTYVFVTPTAFQFLYTYGFVLGATTFINIDDLIQFVLFFSLGGGLSFQVPVIMWIVTEAGLVDAGFWRRNMSYAIVAIVVFGALLTPDGSGITMWLISGPMIVLYLVTYLVLRRRK
jgi:sec-independent protein translocase protein TatC